MTATWMFYYCKRCGYHTATYETRNHCLNCRADEKHFQLIGSSNDPDIEHKIEALTGMKFRGPKGENRNSS